MMTTTRTLIRSTRPLPNDAGGRLLLAVLRRMRWHGPDDALASSRLFGRFGQTAPRALFVTRMLAAALGEAPTPLDYGTTQRTRMTIAEAMLIDAAGRVASDPAAARLLLRDVLGMRNVERPLAALHAVGEAFARVGAAIGATA